MKLSPRDEKTFEDIFGGQADNAKRLENHERKKGKRLLKYRHNGDIGFAVGRTERECHQRALVKCNADDYQEISIEPLDGWMKR